VLYYLGRNLSSKIPGVKVFPTYRNAGKLNQAGLQLTTDGSKDFPANVTPLITDILDISNDFAALQSIVAAKTYQRLIVINNAGVCLEGNTRSILQETLQVNCLFPAFLSEAFINRIDAEKELIVINVSSGDGELSYLHSDIQRKIAGLETFQVSNTQLYLSSYLL
jgi:short-subunit dehydrogenase involved in D-alanine esterification of teichoic acids